MVPKLSLRKEGPLTQLTDLYETAKAPPYSSNPTLGSGGFFQFAVTRAAREERPPGIAVSKALSTADPEPSYGHHTADPMSPKPREFPPAPGSFDGSGEDISSY